MVREIVPIAVRHKAGNEQLTGIARVQQREGRRLYAECLYTLCGGVAGGARNRSGGEQGQCEQLRSCKVHGEEAPRPPILGEPVRWCKRRCETNPIDGSFPTSDLRFPIIRNEANSGVSRTETL